MPPCYDLLIIFSSWHIVWRIKIQTRLFINLSSIVRFSKWLCQDVPYKAETWHAWSQEQYFSKHRFLDICWCAFNDLNGEEIIGIFYEKELQKTNQQGFRIKKVIKRNGNKLYVK